MSKYLNNEALANLLVALREAIWTDLDSEDNSRILNATYETESKVVALVKQVRQTLEEGK